MSIRLHRVVPHIMLLLASVALSLPTPAADRPAAVNPFDKPLNPAPAGPLVMRWKMLADPYAKIDAIAILVPEGWELKGAVNWVGGDATSPQIDLSVIDAAHAVGVRLCPRFYYADGVRENQKRAMMRNDPSGRLWASVEHLYKEGAKNGPGAEIRALPKSPREYVQNILVPKLRPAIAAATDVTVVSETDLPELAKAKLATAASPETKCMSSRFRITMTGPKGPVEEEFICTIRSFPVGPPTQQTIAWDSECSSAWAPRGKLDAVLPVCMAVTASKQMPLAYFNFTQQISQMVLQAQREQLQKMIDDEWERIRIYGEMQQKASAEVSQRIHDNFQKQQEFKAANQEAFMHYINDTDGYVNTATGTKMILPANYTFTYVNNRGETYQTMDATVQPPVDPQTSWTRMEKAR